MSRYLPIPAYGRPAGNTVRIGLWIALWAVLSSGRCDRIASDWTPPHGAGDMTYGKQPLRAPDQADRMTCGKRRGCMSVWTEWMRGSEGLWPGDRSPSGQ